MRVHFAVAVCFAVWPTPSPAQSRLLDLNTTFVAGGPPGNGARLFAQFGTEVAFLSAFDFGSYQLYLTDRTPQGTRRVHSFQLHPYDNHHGSMFELGGRLLFTKRRQDTG